MNQTIRIKFKPEHLDCMNMREHEKGRLDKIKTLVDALGNDCVAHTFIKDGRIITCAGVIPINNGDSGEVWQIPSVYVNRYIREYLISTREYLEEMSFAFNLKRMQTICLNDKLHDRWMMALGFEKEGVMRKYLDGEDYSMFGRVLDGN